MMILQNSPFNYFHHGFLFFLISISKTIFDFLFLPGPSIYIIHRKVLSKSFFVVKLKCSVNNVFNFSFFHQQFLSLDASSNSYCFIIIFLYKFFFSLFFIFLLICSSIFICKIMSKFNLFYCDISSNKSILHF